MIVVCPECRVRYRHDAPGESAASARAQCSRCDTVFELGTAPPARHYRVVDAVAGTVPPAGRRSSAVLPGAPLGIGMDDPSLAARLARGRDGETRAPLSYTVLADEPREARVLPELPPAADAAEDPAAVAPRSGSSVLGSAFFASAAAALGGSAGYYLAAALSVDPLIGLATGAAIGLLAGWSGERWAFRTR